MALPPRIIADRYRVLEEAGRGGMGSVWRCVDERLGREVAVKQVGRMPGESVTDQARALRESRSLAALNHPNVVSVYDSVAEDDHVWLVMEHVQGRTLAQLLRDEVALSPARVAWIGAQVADGLSAAHARGTVHRDVKPGNVLVTDDDRAKISDFGIARTVGDETLTQSGMFTGTPNYIAPEVARGGEPRPASDVWALGATLFAAVEGRAPYDTNPNALAVLTTIATEEPPVPERAGPLTEPIARMLDRDPDSRWSMSEVARALHELSGRHPASAETEDATQALPLPASAAPAPAAAGVRPADERPRGRRRGPLLVAGAVALLVAAIAVLALLNDGTWSPVAETPSATPGTPDPSATVEPEPTEPESTEPEPTEPTEPTEPEPTESTDPEPAAEGSAIAFVEDYYAGLPGDTESGYARLAPSYQAGTSFESYSGFWSTIDEVTVQDVASAGADAVDVTLRYGGGQTEVRRISLEQGDDGWLITDDEVVG